MRAVNAAGVSLIKRFEGLRLEAYQCSAGVWTIGYGHTGKDVFPGMRISEATAESLLARDIAVHASGVEEALRVAVSPNQFAALVSLAFNIGVAEFQHSSLLRRINAGDVHAAAQEFLRWNKVRGVTNTGLVRRREAERSLFLSGAPNVA